MTRTLSPVSILSSVCLFNEIRFTSSLKKQRREVNSEDSIQDLELDMFNVRAGSANCWIEVILKELKPSRH